MKISLKWLSEFFPNTGIDISSHSEKLRTQLPLSGLEIGGVQKPGEHLSQVVVGQIVSFEKHPNADRLNVCQVNVGEAQNLTIVCGAPNVKQGVKVAVARIGTLLPGDLKIKQSKIRDVESFGMLCSEKELELSGESNGIIHLPDSAPIGSPLVKALGLQDEIWEVELTPDRADCLSHFGFAREVGRLLGHRPSLPELDKITPNSQGDVPLIAVEVQAKAACPIYGVQLLEAIQNRPSPDWLKRSIESLGIRSFSSVVDVTNFTMMELGHPMHAFDADKITGSKLIVRFAKTGEKLVTLDGETRTLHAEDLVIADLEKPLALAGVMGGLDSSVTASTTRILLETAVFDPITVRVMSQRHKIHTDSSHRFERGVDAGARLNAVGRAILLIKRLTGARTKGAYVEVVLDKSERLITKQSLNFDLRVFKDATGMTVAAEELKSAFTSVGIDAQVKSANVLKLEIPTHRLDLVREIDLVEEGARLLGYDKIPVRYPEHREVTRSITRQRYEMLRRVRWSLLDQGLTQMMPYSFVSDKDKAWVGDAPLVEIANPLSAEWKYLRPNLSLGLLTVLSRHMALGQSRGRFFDAGHAFSPEAAGQFVPSGTHRDYLAKSRGVRESFHVAIALMGERNPEHWASDKKSSERKVHVDYFDGKGVFDEVVSMMTGLDPLWNALQVVALSEHTGEIPSWIPAKLLHPFKSALLQLPGRRIVGFVGEMNPMHTVQLLNLATGYQLGVVLGEIRILENILEDMKVPAEYGPRGRIEPTKKFPLVQRDVALVVEDTIKAGELGLALKKAAGPLCLDVECLDLYRLGDGKVSLAWRLLLQAEDRTLTDAEIQVAVDASLKVAADKFGAKLRS